MNAFQSRLAHEWAERCFGALEANDPTQRGLRHVEEAIELAQACRVPRDQVLALVEHVYSRPPGDIAQEIGGSALTLAVLAVALGYDLESRCGAELERMARSADAPSARRNSSRESLAGLSGSPTTR